jgi:hypothetical protein
MEAQREAVQRHFKDQTAVILYLAPLLQRAVAVVVETAPLCLD